VAGFEVVSKINMGKNDWLTTEQDLVGGCLNGGMGGSKKWFNRLLGTVKNI
jgi:hypothetical protein